MANEEVVQPVADEVEEESTVSAIEMHIYHNGMWYGVDQTD